MQESRFNQLSQSELESVNFDDFFVRLTIEFGPAANASPMVQEDFQSFLKKQADENQDSFFQALMLFIRDYQAALSESKTPQNIDASSPITITMGACQSCRTLSGAWGQWVYPSFCQRC